MLRCTHGLRPCMSLQNSIRVFITVMKSFLFLVLSFAFAHNLKEPNTAELSIIASLKKPPGRRICSYLVIRIMPRLLNTQHPRQRSWAQKMLSGTPRCRLFPMQISFRGNNSSYWATLPLGRLASGIKQCLEYDYHIRSSFIALSDLIYRKKHLKQQKDRITTDIQFDKISLSFSSVS
jgi:hypothetical protein